MRCGAVPQMYPIKMDHTKAADGAAALTWIAWVIAHLAQINEILQFIVLVLGIISALFAIRYHASKTE